MKTHRTLSHKYLVTIYIHIITIIMSRILYFIVLSVTIQIILDKSYSHTRARKSYRDINHTNLIMYDKYINQIIKLLRSYNSALFLFQ